MADHLGSAAAHQQPTPTPYPDVNAVVHDLLTSLHAILGAQLAGMYLVGSLALGAFDPRESDLDLIIVTVGTLSDETVAALRDLHQRFDHSASAWAARLDAVYLPQEVLREPSPTAARYPILYWPELLVLEPLESGWWPIQRNTLREHGVVVSGPDPRLLVDPAAQTPACWWTPSSPTSCVGRRRPRSRTGVRGRTVTPRGSRGCRSGVSTPTWW